MTGNICKIKIKQPGNLQLATGNDERRIERTSVRRK